MRQPLPLRQNSCWRDSGPTTASAAARSAVTSRIGRNPASRVIRPAAAAAHGGNTTDDSAKIRRANIVSEGALFRFGNGFGDKKTLWRNGVTDLLLLWW